MYMYVCMYVYICMYIYTYIQTKKTKILKCIKTLLKVKA